MNSNNDNNDFWAVDPDEPLDADLYVLYDAEARKRGGDARQFCSPVVRSYKAAVRLLEAREANGYRPANGYDLCVTVATPFAVKHCGLQRVLKV